jgi:hypothetical protein
MHAYGWPEPYIYTVYDCKFGDFPAKITVYTPYINGSGQPYVFMKCGAKGGSSQGVSRRG